MSFDPVTPAKRALRVKPTCLWLSSYGLYLSAEAYKAIGRPAAIKVLYDKNSRTLKLEPGEEGADFHPTIRERTGRQTSIALRQLRQVKYSRIPTGHYYPIGGGAYAHRAN